MRSAAILTLATLGLAACNTNTAPGNDREAHLDPPVQAAPIEDASTEQGLAEFSAQLGGALRSVQQTLEAVSKAENPSLALANATIFLDAMGHVVIAWGLPRPLCQIHRTDNC